MNIAKFNPNRMPGDCRYQFDLGGYTYCTNDIVDTVFVWKGTQWECCRNEGQIFESAIRCVTEAHKSVVTKADDSKKTMRDEFAMAALTSLSVKGYTPSEIGRRCYQLADVMMKERKIPS